jgi:hypothetical protein
MAFLKYGGIMEEELEPLTDTLKSFYASFIFREQASALAFARLVVERDWHVNVAYAPDRGFWRGTVRREIHPVFQEITVWLATLTARAAMTAGKLDGWGPSVT